jgi:hypothetical protein
MPSKTLGEPWRSFLRDLDHELGGPTEVHCFGGFVVAEYYGLSRATADVDVIAAIGATKLEDLRRIAGRDSELAKRHKVYVDIVTVATVPEDYAARLIDIFPGMFKDLRLRAFERHDLALAKLARNADHDREDVKRLATGPGLDIQTLKDRYRTELRYQFANPAREDLTLDLWLEMLTEVKANRPRN